MRPAHLAGIGLALAAVSRAYIAVLLGGVLPPGLLAVLLGTSAGLLLAAAGLGAWPGARGRGLAAAGFSLAAAGATVRVLRDFGTTDLPGTLLIAIGLLQAGGASVLLWAQDGAQARARLAALQLSLGVVLLGGLAYLPGRLGDAVILPGPALLLLGLLLAVVALGRMRAQLPLPAGPGAGVADDA